MITNGLKPLRLSIGEGLSVRNKYRDYSTYEMVKIIDSIDIFGTPTARQRGDILYSSCLVTLVITRSILMDDGQNMHNHELFHRLAFFSCLPSRREFFGPKIHVVCTVTPACLIRC